MRSCILLLVFCGITFGLAEQRTPVVDAQVVGDYPDPGIEVDQSGGTPCFRFYDRDKSLRHVPVAISQVTVLTAGSWQEPLWVICAEVAGTGLTAVCYGETPTGFRQILPQKGAAPQLVVGKEYLITAEPGWKFVQRMNFFTFREN